MNTRSWPGPSLQRASRNLPLEMSGIGAKVSYLAGLPTHAAGQEGAFVKVSFLASPSPRRLYAPSTRRPRGGHRSAKRRKGVLNSPVPSSRMWKLTVNARAPVSYSTYQRVRTGTFGPRKRRVAWRSMISSGV